MEKTITLLQKETQMKNKCTNTKLAAEKQLRLTVEKQLETAHVENERLKGQNDMIIKKVCTSLN